MAKYQEVEWLDVSRKFKKIRRGRKFGIKKVTGERVGRIKYDDISQFVDGVAVVWYRRFRFSKFLMGIITEDGREVFFGRNCRKIIIRNRNVIAVLLQISDDEFNWAIFDSNGVETDIRYSSCPDKFVNGFAKVRKNRGWMFIREKDGQPINSSVYTSVSDFTKNGRAIVTVFGKKLVVDKNGIEHEYIKRK